VLYGDKNDLAGTGGRTLTIFARSLLGGLLLAVAFTSPSPAAEEPVPAEPAAPAAEQSTGSAGEPGNPGDPNSGAAPAATYEDVLFVEETLPYVPDSNTLATKLPLPLLKTPASVGVVSEPLFTEQDGTVLGDALRNVSGLNVQTQSGVADLFLVRGFDSISSGMVLTDGAVEPEISFYQLYNVERVEVLKGPGGFLYGATPTAGTVNLVRKQPAPESFLDVGLSAGSFATYEGRIDVNSSRREGKLGFRANGLWQESAGYRDGKDSRAWAVNPALTWRPGPASTLNVNFERVDTSYSPDAGLPIVATAAGPVLADVPRTRAYESPFDRSDQELTRFQVDYEAVLSERLRLRNKAYYRELSWLSDGTLFNGVFPSFTTGRPEVSRVLALLDDRQRLAGDQIEAVLSLGGGAGSVRHRILAGLELSRLTDEFTLDVALLPGIDLANPVETAARPLFLLPGQSQAADAETRVVAPYLIDEVAFSDRFQLVLGGRFDDLDYDDPVSRTSRQDARLSPLLGAVYSPRPNLSIYANATEAFAPPSSRTVGERRPEESRQVELGIKGNLLGGKVQTTLALYQLERENVAIPDDNGITQQTGSQRARGVELELAAEPRRGMRTFLSYAYNDSELTRFAERVLVGFFPPAFATVDRSGNDPAFAPEHIVNLWASQRFGNGLGLAGGARYLSEQFVAEDNVFALDSALTFDAALFWDRGAQRFSLNLKNLTGEEYETRGFGATSVIPAPGFSVSGGYTYRMGW
jgi:TonB-dependent siderophore receptor